jgi:hypothetical protein
VENFGSKRPLFEVINCTAIQGIDNELFAPEVREHHHRTIWRESPALPFGEKLDAVQVRKPIVEQHAFRSGAIEKLQAGFRRVCLEKIKVLRRIASEETPVELSICCVVVDDQNSTT